MPEMRGGSKKRVFNGVCCVLMGVSKVCLLWNGVFNGVFNEFSVVFSI